MGKRERTRLSGMNVGNGVTSTWRESVNVLMERIFPESGMPYVRNDANKDREMWKQFDWHKVNVAMSSMKCGKASGLDDVNAGMVRAVWRAILECLKRIYDVSLSTGRFPEAWKNTRVVVLLKSLDKVWSDPGSYRPICL